MLQALHAKTRLPHRHQQLEQRSTDSSVRNPHDDDDDDGSDTCFITHFYRFTACRALGRPAWTRSDQELTRRRGLEPHQHLHAVTPSPTYTTWTECGWYETTMRVLAHPASHAKQLAEDVDTSTGERVIIRDSFYSRSY